MQSITAKQLIKTKDKGLLIVDIRKSSTFKEWNIKNSENIDVYDDIWSGNFEVVKKKLSGLPKEKEIITVCNAGVTSQNASMILESMGYKTSFLEKGMMGWNLLHQPFDIYEDNDLLLKQIARIGKGCLSYLVASKSTKECFVIDPSQYVEEYAEIAKENGLAIKGVIETHVHADHLSGAKLLADITKSKYYVSSKDLNAKIDFEDINKNQEIIFGEVKIKIIETPGHTNGSVCLIVNDKLILTGDSLFLEGAGRPDVGRDKKEIENGASALYESLSKIKSLDKNLIVLPAHFTNSDSFPIKMKLADLIHSNKMLQINSKEEFVNYILNNLPKSPPNYEQIKNINLQCMQLPRQMAEQLEFGPNRCASK